MRRVFAPSSQLWIPRTAAKAREPRRLSDGVLRFGALRLGPWCPSRSHRYPRGCCGPPHLGCAGPCFWQGSRGCSPSCLPWRSCPTPEAKPFTAGLRRREGCFSCARAQSGCGARSLAEPGARVAAGTPLLLIYASDRVRLEAEHERVLLEWRRVQALQRDRGARRRDGRAASQALREALDQAAAQNRRAQAHAQRQLETLEGLLAPVLSPGASPALQLPVMLTAQAELQRFGAESQLLRLLQEARGLQRERAQLALAETRQDLAEADAAEALASRLAVLEAKLSRLRAQRRWVLRAPQGGRLLTLPGTPGGQPRGQGAPRDPGSRSRHLRGSFPPHGRHRRRRCPRANPAPLPPKLSCPPLRHPARARAPA